MLPPISAPWLPPNIATHPAATHPTNGIVLRVGAAAAPTLVPTSLPVPSAPPIALIHASLFRAALISAASPCVKPGLTAGQTAEIVAARQSEACIKAIGSAEGTGRLVGTSVGAAAAPTLSTIPFVGWVAAGWVAMFGGNQGAEIGGNMAEDLNKNC